MNNNNNENNVKPGIKPCTTRSENDDNEYCFATSQGRPTEMKHAIEMLKDILKGFCTPEELKGISSYTFRRGYGRWGREHSDPMVKDRVAKNQDRSDSIFEKAYDINCYDEASWVSNAVLSQLWKSGPAEVKNSLKLVGGRWWSDKTKLVLTSTQVEF